MNISRNFIVIGALYLIVGVALGMHMGASGDHSLSALHAHINLLGFTLMTIFGVLYAVFPDATDGMLPKLHFWGHQLGTLLLVIGLYFVLSDPEGADSMAPVMIVAELLVLLSILIYAWNIYKNVE